MSEYFKAKNFGSFVRQLNMYNFHKVRNQKKHYEFRHPFFERNNEANLIYIRRKPVKRNFNKQSNDIAVKDVKLNRQVLPSKLLKMEEILELMGKQNKDLIEINDKMKKELENLKSTWDDRIKDLIDIILNVISDSESSLSKNCGQFLIEVQLKYPRIFHIIFSNSLSAKSNLAELEILYKINIFDIFENFYDIYQNFKEKLEFNDQELQDNFTIDMQIDTQLETSNILEETCLANNSIFDYAFTHSPKNNTINQDDSSKHESIIEHDHGSITPRLKSPILDNYKTFEDIQYDTLSYNLFINESSIENNDIDKKWI